MRKNLSFFIMACGILTCAIVYTKWLVQGVAVPLERSLDEIPKETSKYFGENILTFLDDSDYKSSYARIMRIYRNHEKSLPIRVFVGYWEKEDEGRRIRSPRYTSEGWGYYWQQTKNLDIVNNNKIQLKEFLNERGSEKELVYYAYVIGGQVIPDEYHYRFRKALNSLLYRRNNAALVRVSTPITPDVPLEDAEAYVEDFLKEFLPIVLEYLPK